MADTPAPLMADTPAPAPAFVPAAPTARAAVVPGDDLLAAFLRGTGLPDARPTDPVAAMGALGAAFRELIFGLRQAMIARSAIKGEFRIEQTMIRSRGNNPLKFSADDDDAMLALLGAEQGGLNLVPVQRKARASDAFEALFTQTSQALTNDFDGVFGRAFARAYEQALRETRERENDR